MINFCQGIIFVKVFLTWSFVARFFDLILGVVQLILGLFSVLHFCLFHLETQSKERVDIIKVYFCFISHVHMSKAKINPGQTE